MPLRYLYGDSASFPADYNFLETLEGFLTCAALVGRLNHDIEVLESGITQRATARTALLDSLDAFADSARAHIATELEASKERERIAPYAAQIVDAVNSVIERTKTTQETEARAERVQTEQAVAAKRSEMNRAFDAFFTHYTFEVVATSFSMMAGPEGMTLTGTLHYPGDLVASFALDTDGNAGWVEPVRVRDLQPGIELQLGLKRKFLRKTLEPEIVPIDELYIGAVELSPERCDIRLRRKLEAGDDVMVLELKRADETMSALVRRLEGDDGDGTIPAEASDLPKLERLWEMIAHRSQEALRYRNALRWLRLNGEDVVDHGLILNVLDLFLTRFTPTVAEISKRSSSRAELSLKTEDDEGRREEIYKKKHDLAKLLLPLPDALFERFSVLEIFPDETPST